MEKPAKKPPRIFISHALKDHARAEAVALRLIDAGANVWWGHDRPSGSEPLGTLIEREMAAADYLVVLLSESSVRSAWVRAELAMGLSREVEQRGVTVLPVRIDRCEVPEILGGRAVWDLASGDEGRLVSVLTERLVEATNLDFDKLTWQAFEELVFDLLSRRGFGVERSGRPGLPDTGFDAVARWKYVDPFGRDASETWAVEVRFYARSRPGLEQVHEFAGRLSTFPGGRGLLVTNGRLTSAAARWLEASAGKAGWVVRVLDGSELRSLLLEHPDLVKRHFGVSEVEDSR